MAFSICFIGYSVSHVGKVKFCSKHTMKLSWRWLSNFRRKETPYHRVANGVSTLASNVDSQDVVVPLNNSVARDSTHVSYSQVASYILPHLWPERSLLKLRVLFCLLLVFLAKFANFLTPLALRSAVDFLGGDTQTTTSKSFLISFLKFPSVYMAVLSYAFFRLASTLLGELRQGLWQRVSQDTTRSLAVRSFSHILDLSYEFHLSRKTGDIVSTLDRGINSISTLLGTFVFTLGPTVIELFLVCSVFVSLGSFVLAFTTALSVIAYGVWSVWLSEWRRTIRRQVNAKDNMVREKTVEAFGNFETVKYFCAEGFETQRYVNAVEEYFEVSRKSQWSLSLLNSGQSFWICLGLGSAMLMTASRVMSMEESVGTFVMVNAYILQLYQPLSFLGTAYRMISSALTDLEKLILLLREQPSIQDKPGAPSLKCQGGEVSPKAVEENSLKWNVLLRFPLKMLAFLTRKTLEAFTISHSIYQQVQHSLLLGLVEQERAPLPSFCSVYMIQTQALFELMVSSLMKFDRYFVI